jgi:serine/threonine-protein kinase
MSHFLERLRQALADRYRVERELGRGGMATVFLGEDLKHRRRVAIKVLDPDLSAALGGDRFRQEIEFAATLQHPHILTLLDSGSAGGLLYYVMPLVEGDSLRTRLQRERQLPVEDATRLAGQVALALDYAHRQGVVHRDIKPENILLADGQAVVSDFGIARAIRASGGERFTGTGVTLGTPRYMSPEQLTGTADIDGRSDIYSLGCVLYEMLTGQPPFTGPAETLAHQHLNVAARPVSQLRPSVAPPLQTALDRALAKMPADRFSSAARFAEALAPPSTAGATVAMTQPRSPAAAGSPRARGSRSRVRGWIVAGLVVATIGVAWRMGAFDALLPQHAAAGERRWVWLAGFDGPADDPTLAPAARDVIASAIDESGVLATVPAEQVGIALRNAGRPDTARIDATLARQLAYRSAIPIVVTGRVRRLGGDHHITVQALEAERGRVLFSSSRTASGERALIPTLTRLARDLRRGLGERPEALRARGDVFDAETPSFEAFKLFTKGRALVNANQSDEAIPMFRAAIALDPDFATAWGGLGTCFGNLGRGDSARAAHREALRRPDRLTPARRQDLLAKIASIEGRDDDAAKAYEAMLALDPAPQERAVALNNLALARARQGRFEESLELYRASAKAWPIEVPPLTHFNIGGMLVTLGRYEEARAVPPGLRDSYLATLIPLLSTSAEGSWSEAESLSAILVSSSSTPGFFRRVAWVIAMNARGAQGETESVLNELRQLVRATAAETNPNWISNTWLTLVTTQLVSGRELDAVPSSLPADAALRGIRVAWSGDASGSRRAIAPLQSTDPPSTLAELQEHVSGALAYRRGHWPEAIERLSKQARDGRYDPGSPFEVLRLGSRWMVADAHMHSQRPDSAAYYLGLMLDLPGRPPHVRTGLIEPFVRARRIRALSAAGRGDEVLREWERLSRLVTRPEPEMVALLAETRPLVQAVAALRADRR